MTNKTIMAMFVIATVAVISIGVTPAMALPIINSAVTANTGTADSGYTFKACGTSQTCEGKVRSSTTSDWVKANFGTTGTCDIRVQAWVNGVSILDTTRIAHTGTGNFITVNTAVNNGDSITSTNTFTNCV